MKKLSKIESEIMNKLFEQGTAKFRIPHGSADGVYDAIVSLWEQDFVTFSRVEHDYNLIVVETTEMCDEAVADGEFHCDGDDVYYC
jgi:hypothetical protein